MDTGINKGESAAFCVGGRGTGESLLGKSIIDLLVGSLNGLGMFGHRGHQMVNRGGECIGTTQSVRIDLVCIESGLPGLGELTHQKQAGLRYPIGECLLLPQILPPAIDPTWSVPSVAFALF